MKLEPLALSQPLSTLDLPLRATAVECGFPSPADDYLEGGLDLNEHLIPHPAATYFAKANGDSLNGHGIFHGDLLVVSRSATRRHNSVVVVSLDGHLACKVLDLHKRCFRSSHPDYPDIPVPEDSDVVIEGVVTHAVHYLES